MLLLWAESLCHIVKIDWNVCPDSCKGSHKSRMSIDRRVAQKSARSQTRLCFWWNLQEDPEFPKHTLRSKLVYLLNVHLCLIFLFRHLILISQGQTAQSGKHHILPQSNRWAALTPNMQPVFIFFFHHAHESFLEDILLGWSWSFPPTLSPVTILPKPPYVLPGRPAL